MNIKNIFNCTKKEFLQIAIIWMFCVAMFGLVLYHSRYIESKNTAAIHYLTLNPKFNTINNLIEYLQKNTIYADIADKNKYIFKININNKMNTCKIKSKDGYSTENFIAFGFGEETNFLLICNNKSIKLD